MIIEYSHHRPHTEPSLALADNAPLTADRLDTLRLYVHRDLDVLTERGISIVLPAWNEAENIADTVQAVVATMSRIAPNFEVIVVDDGSTDRTGEIADELAAADARVRVIHNHPNKGYGGALTTGFDAAEKDYVFFMDSDGQFDIKDIEQLIIPMEEGQADIILGYRAHRQDPPLRLLNAWAWKRLVSLLFRLHVRDIDCAFKLIPTHLMRQAQVESHGAMVNTEFLAKFVRMDATMAQVPVNHYPRSKGKATGANIGVILRAFRELFALAHKLRNWSPTVSSHPIVDGAAVTGAHVSPSDDGEGGPAHYRAWLATHAAQHAQSEPAPTILYHEPFVVGDQQIQTFSPLPASASAVQTMTRGQVGFLVMLVLAWVASLVLWGATTLVASIGFITVVYLGDLLLTAMLAARTLNHSPEERISDALVTALADAEWPHYTILCPLYRETEVVTQFAHAMEALDYPKDRLQIMFLTEADDAATRNAILGLGLPPHFQVITVPDGELRTKPRACNYGLLRATGEYVVIFDAEDIPDPLQLKKAVLTFANHGADLACVQAKLNFYNPRQNLLTRWFTNEYTLWFDLTLPGLQWLKTALPLGGTSNHFRTATLQQVGAWDPFNVTEDCDLGLRLAQHKLRTVVLDSTTMEEANSRPKNWIRQRSRWIKGYLQTYLVHMRNPMKYVREGRIRDFLALQLVVGARSATLYVNPLMWALLGIYVAFRGTVEQTYHTLYPAPIFYMGMICLIFGNFIYIYTYMVACAKRREYGMMRWALLIPIYWAMMSVAASMALVQLIFKPYFWEKTQHGLHLKSAQTAVSVMDLSVNASFTVERQTAMEE